MCHLALERFLREMDEKDVEVFIDWVRDTEILLNPCDLYRGGGEDA